MKFILPFVGLALGIAVGGLAAVLAGLHWFLAMLIGFCVFVAFTRLSEHYMRATAEKRAIKAFKRSRR